MPKSDPATTFDNMTQADLIDEFGKLMEKHKPLAKRLEAIKTELKKRKVRNGAKGKTFDFERVDSPTARLDTEAIKAAQSARWLSRFTKTGVRVTLSAKRRAA